MARLTKVTPNKTYATEANAVKAVEKVFPSSNDDQLRYIIIQHTDGRYFPVFVGMNALQEGVHFHFNVLA